MQHLPAREDVPTQLTWDLTTIYPDDSAWETDFKAVRAQAKAAVALKGTLGNSADALVTGIKAVLAVFRRFEKVYVYSSLKSDQDTGNATYQAMNAKAESLGAELASQLAFLDPEILDGRLGWRNTRMHPLHSQSHKILHDRFVSIVRQRIVLIHDLPSHSQ